MILSEKKSMPIVNALIDNAIEQIKNSTGATLIRDEVIEMLCNYDWVFEVNIDSEENYVDLTQLVSCLDNVIEEECKRITEEIRDNVETMFQDELSKIYTRNHILNGEITLDQQLKWDALIDETSKLFTELAIQNGSAADV